MGQLKIRLDTLKKITLYIAPPLFTWCLRHGHNQTHPGSSAPYQRTLPWLSGRQIPWCCPQRKSAQPLLGWYHHWSADGGSWTQATGSWTSGNLRDESDAPYLPVFTLNLTGPNTAMPTSSMDSPEPPPPPSPLLARLPKLPQLWPNLWSWE